MSHEYIRLKVGDKFITHSGLKITLTNEPPIDNAGWIRSNYQRLSWDQCGNCPHMPVEYNFKCFATKLHLLFF